MKEAIQKIMVSKIQCSGITGIEGIPQSSAEIAEMLTEFVKWLIDEQEIFKGELTEKYIINDNLYIDGHKLQTLDELFNHWFTEIYKKREEMKTIDEVLIENGISIIQDGNYYMKYGCNLNKIKKAMEEYAALKVAEDREEHLMLEVKTMPSDEDIINYAYEVVNHKDLKPANRGLIKDAIIIGAKALRDGKIKAKK